MVSGLICGRLATSFMNPVHAAGKTQAGLVASLTSYKREVVRPWWGSEPSFTLLLGHKGEVPMGREQRAGRHVPTHQCHCVPLTHVGPCVRSPLGKGGSCWLPEPTATGQSGGTKCIFHAWASLIHSLSSIPADTALMPLSSLPAFIWNLRREEVKVDFNQVQKTQ